MKVSSIVLVAAAALATSGVALAKGKKGNDCFVCKVSEQTVEIAGKTCHNSKEKKRASKECKKQKGTWVKEDPAAAEAVPMDEGEMME